MGRHIVCLAAILAVVGLSASQASAVTVGLAEWALNIDGSVYGTNYGAAPGYVNTAGFDFGTGLGTITMTYTPGPGTYAVDSFFDLEIDQATNTFFNEYGGWIWLAGGTPGQSWEIDEPGYVFGDIFNNFLASTLDNTIGAAEPDDVAMALGWDFTLGVNQYAVITYNLEYVPVGQSHTVYPGWTLKQTDSESPGTVYFDSKLQIRETGEYVIPEPVTMTGALMGLVAVAGYVRKRRK